MVTLRPRITLKNIGFSSTCAVILCLLQPLLAAQLDNGVISGVAPRVIRHAAPSAQACQSRVNDTPEKLLECVRPSELWQHLAHFQQIADNHKIDGHGYRDTGTPGYKASVDYVAGLVRKAGYKVTIQTYQYRSTEVVGIPRLSASSENYVWIRDWYVARLSGGGTVTAPVQPVGGSGNGCLRSEFAGFIPGNVALLERGACSYDLQVANSQVAGASAVVIYNTPDVEQDQLSGLADPVQVHDTVFQARLTRQASIPVIGVASYSVGSELRRRHASGNAPQLHIEIRTQPKAGEDYNLIAESPFGDPNHTVIVEGHLDSIYGAGMLDNASGSTTILEIALNMAKTSTRNRLRYIWFGGEELGLLGSAYYTQHLSSSERKHIAFDIDADVTATPNFDIWIADPATACNVNQFPSNVVPQSKVGTKMWTDYFNSIGVVSQSAPFGNCGTDSNSFALIGTPDTGILTMQDCCKSQSEVDIWGGFLNNYEGQVPGNDGGCCDYPERWCDNLDNNDPFVFGMISKATAYVTLKLSNHPFRTARP